MNVQHEYSQGVCEDGAAILCDGRPMPIEQIIIALRLKDAIQIKNDNLKFCLDKEIARIQDMWKDIERLKALADMEKIAATAAIRERDELKAKNETMFETLQQLYRFPAVQSIMDAAIAKAGDKT